MSDNAGRSNDPVPCGMTLLPRDLIAAQLEAAPVLASVDQMVIDELIGQEYDDFVAALRS
jgi:hypothetical protein